MTYEQISVFDILNTDCESRLRFECRTGSGFEGGRVRIYCASCNLGIKELAKFLKDEYGVGGHSITFPDGVHGFTDYNGSGMTIRAWKEKEIEKHSWNEVATEIKRLIYSGEYLNQKEYYQADELIRKNGGTLPVPQPRLKLEVTK